MLPVSPVVSLARNGTGGYGNNIPGSRPAPARKSNERSRPNWLAWLLIVLVFIAIVIVSIYIFRDLSQTARKGANSPRNASP